MLPLTRISRQRNGWPLRISASPMSPSRNSSITNTQATSKNIRITTKEQIISITKPHKCKTSILTAWTHTANSSRLIKDSNITNTLKIDKWPIANHLCNRTSTQATDTASRTCSMITGTSLIKQFPPSLISTTRGTAITISEKITTEIASQRSSDKWIKANASHKMKSKASERLKKVGKAHSKSSIFSTAWRNTGIFATATYTLSSWDPV